MASDRDTLRMARKMLAELSRLVDEQQARIDGAAQRLSAALERLRSVCSHAFIVQVALPPPLKQAMPGGPGCVRFCLDCGEGDFALPQGDPRDPTTLFRFMILTGTPNVMLPEEDLERFVDRLNAKGRFDEFDEFGQVKDPAGGLSDDEN